jgi:hypothetical protein
MSDELLNLSNELLKNEELDVEGHIKKSKDEPREDKDADDVEAHLLDQNLLNQDLLDL